MVAVAAHIGAFAADDDRTAKLEKELQELKQRVSVLEGQKAIPTAPQSPARSSEGWKLQSNWRMLKTGLASEEVRILLGEPERIRGGYITVWYYPNGGYVAFTSDKLSNWVEP